MMADGAVVTKVIDLHMLIIDSPWDHDNKVKNSHFIIIIITNLSQYSFRYLSR